MKLAVIARMAWMSEIHCDNTLDKCLGHTVSCDGRRSYCEIGIGWRTLKRLEKECFVQHLG